MFESLLALDTKELKYLWDTLDTDEDLEKLEEIHTILNKRGEGKYCAV